MKWALYGFLIAVIIAACTEKAFSHEMVPTYPKFEPAYLDGLYKTTMTVFNKRPEVEYYEIGVFDNEWNPLPFVSNYKVHKIPYLSTVTFDLYIRNQDKLKVVYICSQSKLLKQNKTATAVTSRICSKVKGR